MMPEPAMIYLVTSGCYSDYTVVGVFSTRAAADAYVAWRNGPDDEDDYRVEEYGMDAVVKGETGCYRAYGPPFEARDPMVPHVLWDPDAVVGLPLVEAAPRGFRIIASGATREHAIRSYAETYRAIMAGTLIPPRWGGSHA